MQKGTVMLAAAVMYTVPYESCPLSPQWSILWDCCIPIWPLSSIVRSSQPHYSLGFTSLYSLLRVMEHLSPPPPHPAALHTHHLALSQGLILPLTVPAVMCTIAMLWWFKELLPGCHLTVIISAMGFKS